MKPVSKLWLALSGILLVITGVCCIARPDVALASAAWIIGVLTLFSGISSLLFALDAQEILPNAGTMTLAAVVRILVGVFFLANSLLVALSLPILFALWIIFESVYLSVESFSLRKAGAGGWWCVLCLGVCGIALGVAALARPEAAAASLGTLVGIGVLAAGVARCAALVGIRRIERALRS